MVSRNPYLEPTDDDTLNRPNPMDDGLKSSQSRRYLKSFFLRRCKLHRKASERREFKRGIHSSL